MSRIGKQPVAIPEGVNVSVEGNTVTVRGTHGELSREFPREVSIEVNDKEVIVTPTRNSQRSQILWGTWSSHVRNMVTGVSEKFEKKLVVEGVGFKTELQGKNLVMQLGFSHPVEIEIPEGLDVSVEKEMITVSGTDKEKVGHFAAVVRSKKKPEPYKGKGIRYNNEVIRRKQGKKAVGSGG